MGLSVLMLILVICLQQPGVLADQESNPRLVTAGTSYNFERDAQASNENSAAVVVNRYTFEGDEFETSRNYDEDETEYRVFYGGVLGMEISFHETGLIFRQMTDGEKIVQLIYDGSGLLVECEVEEDTEALDDFLARFLQMDVNAVRRMIEEDKSIDVNNLIGNRRALEGNLLYELLENRKPRKLLVTIQNLEQQCIDLHHIIEQNRGADREVYQDTSDNIQEITHKNRREVLSDNSPSAVRQIQESIQHAASQRRKRQLGIGRYPGTHWCGISTSAVHYDDLGVFNRTDSCCREHDHCQTYISALSTKYHYYNPYWYTISHCDCDDTFRACLKDVGSFTSDAVGRLFFDLTLTRCFVLQQEKVCTSTNFWGRCIGEYAYEDVAKLQPHVWWN